MSLFSPEYFKCQHEKLNKKKSKNIYGCNQCNQSFIIIPLKHDLISHDKKPKLPDLDPDLKNHPDFIR